MLPSHALRPRLAVRHAGALAVLVGVLGLMLSACGSGTTTALTSTPTLVALATGTATSHAASPTATAGGIPVKVYFSKHPESDSNVNAVFSVNRLSPSVAVGTYAIQQLIVGPSGAEQAAGFFTELGGSLTGTSNCGGADFQYTIDNASHTGTLRFCRTTQLAGDLVGARIKAEINATLTQFPNVTKVVILNSAGHCFDDMSGMDTCLH